MAGSCNNIQLLLPRQVDELNGIAGYTNRKVGVLFLFRMLHRVNQLFCAEYIDVQVVCTLIKIAIHNLHQIADAFLWLMSQCIRIDGLDRKSVV